MDEEKIKPDEFEAFYQMVLNVSRRLGVSPTLTLLLIIAFELRCIHDHFNMMLKEEKE